MWKFLRALFSEWGSAVTGGVSAPLVVAAIMGPKGVPRWISGIFAVFCFYIAAYRVWARERTERERLYDQVVGFPVLRLAPNGFHAQPFFVRQYGVTNNSGQRTTGSAVHYEALRLRIINEPEKNGVDSVARQVTATVEFFAPNGDRLVLMDGRWSDSPQHSQRDVSKDFVTNILAVDFPVGTARDLDIVCKRREDNDCYALNNDNFAPGVGDIRLEDRRLPKGHILAKVRVRASHVDSSFELRFSNDGSGAALRPINVSCSPNIETPKAIK